MLSIFHILSEESYLLLAGGGQTRPPPLIGDMSPQTTSFLFFTHTFFFVLFSLISRPYPPPPSLNGPAIKRRTFYCGFPQETTKMRLDNNKKIFSGIRRLSRKIIKLLHKRTLCLLNLFRVYYNIDRIDRNLKVI